MINFEVELVECLSNHEEYDGRYTVLMWCSWFHNLADIAKDLSEIEDKFEKI